MEEQRLFSKPDLDGIDPERFMKSLQEANANMTKANQFNHRNPKVGEVVIFTPNPDDAVAKSNHNPDNIAAIVTRVWSSVCVNLKIIPDHGPMQDRGSVTHISANPAGYHFQFMDEVYPLSTDPSKVIFK